jgi:hypothetical protein
MVACDHKPILAFLANRRWLSGFFTDSGANQHYSHDSNMSYPIDLFEEVQIA